MTTSAAPRIDLDEIARLSTQRPVRLRLGRLIDGVSAHPRRDVDVVFDATQILSIGDAAAATGSEPDAHLPDHTLLPTLIEAHAHLFLAEALRDLLEREPRASVALIASTPELARGFHRLVADLPEARLVLDGEFTFRPGLDVTEVGQVKGLEFDYVIVPDASAAAYPDTEDARRRLHVAVTRASHQLWVTTVGTPSPLVRSLRAS